MNKTSTAAKASQPVSDSTGNQTPFTGGWLDGTLVMFEPARELFFVRSKANRRKVAVHWEADTQFVLGGRPASSAELQRGQQVHVHCRMSGHELSADHICIEPPSPREAGLPKDREVRSGSAW